MTVFKKYCLLLVLCFFHQLHLFAQEQLAYKEINPAHSNNINGSLIGQIEVDGVGNRYIYGSYDTAKGNDFDGLTATGDYVRFLANYDGSGQIKWVKGVTDSRHRSSKIATNTTGDTWIAAEIFKNAVVDGTMLTIQGKELSGHDDLFLVRYNATGNRIALVQLQSFESREILLDMETDEAGNAYILFATDGKTGMYDLDLDSPHRFSLVLAKFSPTGAFIYAEKLAAMENDFDACAFELNKDGSISGAGAAASSTVHLNGIQITAKESYFFKWSKAAGFLASGKIYDDSEQAIQVNIKDIALDEGENIVFTGATVVGKIDLTGILLWQNDSRHTGTFQSDHQQIKTDAIGNAYIIGHTKGGFPTLGSRFEPCDNRPTRQGFTTKINADGNHLWSVCNGFGTPLDLAFLADESLLVLKTDAKGTSTLSTSGLSHYTNPNPILISTTLTEFCELDSLQFIFDGTNLPGGVYLIQLSDTTGNFPQPYDAIASFSPTTFPHTISVKLPIGKSPRLGSKFQLRVVKGNLSTNLSMPFIINPAPEVKFDRPAIDACTGSNVTLNTNQGGLLPDLVIWEAADSLSIHPNLINATLHNIQTSQTVFARFEMETTGCKNVDSITINQYDYDVSIIGPDTTYEAPTNWSATINGAPRMPLTYEWTNSYFGTGSETDSYTTDYNAIGYDDIYLKLIDNHGCIRRDTSTFLSIVPVILRGFTVDFTNSLPLGNTLVEIFGIGTTGTAPLLIDSVYTPTTGFFTKEVNGYADYLVKVIPDAFDYPGNLPTYYDKKLFIQDASPLPFIRFNEAYPRINALPATMQEDSLGGGIITAFITENSGGRNSGGPVKDLAVWLMDTNKNPLRMATTDAFGYLEFTNLPVGKYYFFCDKYGINNDKAPGTVLDATTMEKELDFLLSQSALELQTITNTTEISIIPTIKFYPNPGKDFVNYQLPSNFIPTNYRVIDQLGKELAMGKLSNNQQQLHLDFLPKGGYIIELIDASNQRIIGKWHSF